MDEYVLGILTGVAVALFVVFVAVDFIRQHDIGMTHNVCMVIDDKNTQRCINGHELIEILRKQ